MWSQGVRARGGPRRGEGGVPGPGLLPIQCFGGGLRGSGARGVPGEVPGRGLKARVQKEGRRGQGSRERARSWSASYTPYSLRSSRISEDELVQDLREAGPSRQGQEMSIQVGF